MKPILLTDYKYNRKTIINVTPISLKISSIQDYCNQSIKNDFIIN